MVVNFAYRGKEFSADIKERAGERLVIDVVLVELRDDNGVIIRAKSPWWNGAQSHLRKMLIGQPAAEISSILEAD